MKKFVNFMFIILTFGLIGSVTAQNSDVTLVYLASQGWIKDAEMELAEQFEAETGIHIDYQIIPADQYFNILQTRLTTGEGIDIFGGQSGVTDLQILYDVEQNAVDLSDEEWISRADPLSVAETTLNDTTYGLTIWDTRGGIFDVVYNSAIFEEYGLEVPTTYAGLRSICETLLANDIVPIYEPISDGWHHVLWFPELGARYEEVTPGLSQALNSNETTFAENETMLTALDQLDELYGMGCFGEFALSDAVSDSAELLASGEYAMTVSTLNLPSIIERDFDVPADQFGFFVMPLADNQNLNQNPGGPSKFIYSGSEHVEEAREYFRFLASPESLQYLIDNDDDFASLNFSGLMDEFTDAQRDFFNTYTNRGAGYQVIVSYVNPQWMEMGQDITAMFIDDIEPIDVYCKISTSAAPRWQQPQMTRPGRTNK